MLLGNVELAVYRAWALFYTGQGDNVADLVGKLELKYTQLDGAILGR